MRILRRRRGLVIAAVLAGQLVEIAASQTVTRAVRQFGAQTYLISETRASGFSTRVGDEVWSICADSDRGTGAYVRYIGDEVSAGDVYLRDFDAFANGLHAAVDVELDIVEATGTDVARAGEATWVCWVETSPQFGASGRIFDSQGQPLCPTFPLFTGSLPPMTRVELTSDSLQIVVADDQTLVLLTTARTSGNTNNDFYASTFTPSGAIIENLHPLVATAWPNEELRPRITRVSDGGYLLANVYVTNVTQPQVHIRRVGPTLSVSPAQVVGPGDDVYVRTLDSGAVLVIWRERPMGTGAWMRLFDANAQPLGSAVAIDPEWNFAAATSDGRFVLAGAPEDAPSDKIWLQFYSPAGQPLTGRVDPILLDSAYGGAFGAYVNDGLAYADDGTVYMVWDFHPPTGFVRMLNVLRPFAPGDLNGDGAANNFDIDAFVLALIDPAAYEVQFPGLPSAFLGDMNGDGAMNNFDIEPFVDAILGNP